MTRRLRLGHSSTTVFVNNSNCDGVTYAQRIDIPDILSWIVSYVNP